MIDCVSIANCHCFHKNLVTAQHQLRYKEVIQKEHWANVYVLDDMEFDRYDNVATEYLIARNDKDQVVGVSRLYPTTIPYMLSESFSHLFSEGLISSPTIFEASRLVLDRSILSKEERVPVINQLIVAYLERGLARNIDAYIGFMLPKIWDSTFLRTGWDVTWLGEEAPLAETDDKVRAGLMPVTKEVNRKVREVTGIYEDVLNYGLDGSNTVLSAALLSSGIGQEEQRKAA